MVNEQAALEKQAKIASIALSEMQKSIRFFRLYPASHPFCVQSVVDTRQRMRRYFEKHQDLLVEVQRDGLYLEEINVLQESGQSTDVSTLLYPEGILGVTFQTSVTDDELGDFMRILSASYIPGAGEEADGDDGEGEEEADLLTSLWEREFQGIRLHIQDQLAPGSTGSADPELNRIQERIAGLLRAYQVGGDTEADPFADRGRDQAIEQKLNQLRSGALMARADPLQLEAFQSQAAGAERRKLREEISDFVLHDPGGRASRIVEWASSQGVRSDPELVAKLRLSSALNAVEQGNLDRAVEIIEKIAGDEGRVSTALSKRLGSAKALRLVAEALERADEAMGPDALIRHGLGYLERLDPVSARRAAEVYPSLEHANVRRVFRRFLSAHAGTEAEAIEPLTLLEDEQLVKEAVGILAMGGKNSRAWEVLTRLAGDEEHELRASLAERVVGRVTGTAQSQKLLKVLLDSENGDERKAAAKQLSKVGKPVIYEKLVELVQSKEFSSRGNSEITYVFKALHRAGGARAVVVLQELAKKKTRLFGRKEAERVRVLAHNWLANTKEDRRRKK